MTRCEKLLQKARSNPKGLRFSELERLAVCCGFEFARQRGTSHRTYKHRKSGVSVPIQPDKNGMAHRYQVLEILKYCEEGDEE
jgi:predicted RNA binding protein YcfA (HicA-like mRNA interferase family)